MKKGFTLMELLVVIAIVAVVSVAATISFSNIDDATNQKELENKYIEIQRAGSLYMDLHSDRLEDFVKDNRHSAYVPLSVLEQEGYLTSDLSDPTGGADISKSYSVKIVIGDNLESVETCIVKAQAGGDECIANKNGKKGNCCNISSPALADLGDDDYQYEDSETPPNITDTNTGITKFDKGRVVNSKMKSLAAGTNISYGKHDHNITAIKYASSLKSDFVESEDNIVSASDSKSKIYIWFDRGTIYFYSEDKKIYLNADGYFMFGRLNALKDISGLSHVITNNLETLQGFFYSCYSLSDLTPISNWNTSKVKSMRSFLNIEDADVTASLKAGSVASLKPLTNWNVSNVIDMKYTFQDQPKLKDLKGLEKWDVRKVKYMDGIFAIPSNSYNLGFKSNLSDISALKNWKTDSLESMYYMFSHAKITSLNGLENWKTDKVTNMKSLFFCNYNLNNIKALKDWKTGNVTDMSYMFLNNYSLSDISHLSNWNVEKVKNLSEMFNVSDSAIEEFNRTGNLRNISYLSNWKPASVENLSWMFQDQLKINDYSALNSWKPYLTHVTSADRVFGLSYKAKSKGFACNNKLAELKSELDWPSSVTNLSNFYVDIDKCTE